MGSGMKIIYKENPLETVVELDDSEKELIRLKVRAETIFEDAYMASYYLREDKFDLEKVRAYIGYISRPKELEEHLEELTNGYLESLQSSHCGDCVCFACSCEKCYAESKIGIDTISGLGSHSANKIMYEFREHKTIDEVINSLDNYNPVMGECWKDNVERWKSHLPRWKEEAKVAAEWLKNYKKEHLE